MRGQLTKQAVSANKGASLEKRKKFDPY